MLGGLFDRRARRFCGGEPWGAGAGREFSVDDAWYVFILCSLMGIWFFILDIFGNLDPGKRLVKIELLSNGQKFTVSTAIKHSVLKTLFCCIWPISFLYYIVKQEMIYDRILKISVSSRP